MFHTFKNDTFFWFFKTFGSQIIFVNKMLSFEHWSKSITCLMNKLIILIIYSFFISKYMLNLILGFFWFHHQISKSNTLGHPLRCKPQPFFVHIHFWASAYSISPNLGFQNKRFNHCFSGPLLEYKPHFLFFSFLCHFKWFWAPSMV